MRAILCFIFATGICLGAGPDLETHCLDCHRPEQRRGEVPPPQIAAFLATIDPGTARPARQPQD